jgi:hypothetical protein
MPVQQPEKVAEFIATIRANAGDLAASTGLRLIEWGHDRGMRDYFFAKPNVHGLNYAPLILGVDWDPIPYTISDLRGEVWVQGDVQKHKPFSQDVMWSKLLEAIHQIPGMIQKEYYPHITLVDLAVDEAWEPFTKQMEWMVRQIKRFNPMGL